LNREDTQTAQTDWTRGPLHRNGTKKQAQATNHMVTNDNNDPFLV